jgi:hypothetical protein
MPRIDWDKPLENMNDPEVRCCNNVSVFYHVGLCVKYELGGCAYLRTDAQMPECGSSICHVRLQRRIKRVASAIAIIYRVKK